MEEQKILGKITYAEFGQNKDRPFLFGLELCFDFPGRGSGVCSAGKYTLNISPDAKWASQLEKLEALNKMITLVDKILSDAKVHSVSELRGKPVEVTLHDDWFKDFRILTEVI